LTAIVRQVRTLTGGIFYSKPTCFSPQRIFQDGFPNYEAPSPIRHLLSPISRRRTTTQQSGQSDAKKATGVKATDAADAYEHILTIQNAPDLEFQATDPATDPQRAEFRLGIFPPDHHVPPAAPTPNPAQTTKLFKIVNIPVAG
jgi:hypothetical protein